MAKEYGFKDTDALITILRRESGLSPYAVNKSSGACGLFQRIHCGLTLGDVEGQAKDGLNYIKNRYGSPTAALKFWNLHSYY